MIRDHKFIDDRSRAFHGLIAQRIRENPALLVKEVRPNALRFIELQPSSRAYFERWLTLIDHAISSGDMEPLTSFMVEDSQRADAARQGSVFVGIIPNKERLAFLREWSDKLTSPTARNDTPSPD